MEVVDGHGCSLYSVFASREALDVRVRGFFGSCKRTAKYVRGKDMCCVIKLMRNQPQGRRSLLPQGSGWSGCLVMFLTKGARRRRSVFAHKSGVTTAHAQSLHVLQKKCSSRVVSQTPLCRDLVTNGKVASLNRTGWRIDTSIQEQGDA